MIGEDLKVVRDGPRIVGEMLPRRVSLPSMMLDKEARDLSLTPGGDWVVKSFWEGEHDERRDSQREGDTGETTEWVVFPSVSKGKAMTVDLLPGQSVRISRVAHDSLRAVVTDVDGEQIADTTYRGVFLLIREHTVRPIVPAREGAFL